MFAIFLFPAFAEYNTKLKKYKGLFAVLGFVWWGLTAFSRMTVGAHYLTDVCIAGLIAIIVWGIVNFIKTAISKKENL